jgi:hypothetical protein
MKRRASIAIVAAIAGVGALAALAYVVVMRDGFMPRAQLGLAYAAALDYSILTADLSALDAEAKQKHGPDARAVYGPGGAAFYIGDRLIEKATMPRKIHRIYGLFAVGRGDSMQRFPYSIVPNEAGRQKREPLKRERLERFQSRAPDIFRFTDSDWRLEGCRTIATPGVGVAAVDAWLQFGSSDVCRVRWLKEPRATMLIGGVAAEGGTWIRHWVVPLCRILAKGWLDQLQRDEDPIDYIACNVIYDPHRPTGGPGDLLQERVYRVTRRGLAVVE